MNSENKKIKSLYLLMIILFLFSIPLFVKNAYWLHVLIIVGINVLLVVSVHTIWCIGELALGTAGFMAVGAYSSALLAMKVGFPVWLSMFFGGLICMFIALALGYPFMRVKGIYFSILTLLTGEIFRLTAWYYRSLTGGPLGLSKIPPPEAIGIPWFNAITFNSKTSYYYVTLTIVVLSVFILYRLQNSQIGQTWVTIREKDNLAEAVGINILKQKIFVFSVGSFFIGIAGSLFAHFMRLLAADASGKFGMFTSIYMLIYMVVGGGGKFSGPIIGAIILTILPEIIRPLLEYRPIVFGAMVIFIVFFMPKGIIALPNVVLSFLKRIIKKPALDSYV